LRQVGHVVDVPVAGRPACNAKAPSMTHFTIGPAISAPVTLKPWNGTLTATATVGSVAGANAIIQSSVSFVRLLPTWAVPVLAATSSAGRNPTSAGVPYFTTSSINGTICASWAGVKGVFHTESL